MDNSCGVGVIYCSEAKLIHNCDGSCTHGQNVADDATDSGGSALEWFDVAGVVVAFNLEGDCHALADVYNTGVFTHADHQVFFHLGGYLLTKLAKVDLGGLVAAVL